MDSKITNIIIGIVAVIILVAAFMYSGVGTTSTEGLSTEQATGGSEIGAFLRQISAIKTISLDRGVFENKVLANLKDQSKEIEKEVPQKKNPFAPISRQSASLQQTAGASSQTAVVETAPVAAPLTD
ncbi:MAG TPA: hypothetical protein P5056_04110 [Candidatus Paceibacterota bacterium]|nr:hypothetical protein [Candidatus Paceibacterota bacterium]